MLLFGKQVSEYKAIEINMFHRYALAGTIIDVRLDWTIKSSERDHWGFFFHIAVLNYMLIEFAFHDIRHADYEDDEPVGIYLEGDAYTEYQEWQKQKEVIDRLLEKADKLDW